MNDPQHLTRAQKTALRQADQDLEKVLATPEGRRVLTRVIDNAGVFNRSFTGNSETFFREGRRSVGLDLVEHITRLDAMAFAKMQAEMIALRQKQDTNHKEMSDED